MTPYSETHSARCPICRTPHAGAIEFDKPAVLLCDCNRCGKYILKKETFLQLARKMDFDVYRYRISDRINKHYKEFKRPIQIVTFREKPLIQDAITIGRLLSLCQGDAMREEAGRPNRESRSDFTSREIIPLASHARA